MGSTASAPVGAPGPAGGTESDIALERFITFRVSRLAQLIGRGAELTYRRQFGLSVRQWRVLATLAHFGSQSAVEVAARTSLDKSQVSRAVAELQAKRMLRQTVSEDDRRRTELSLTVRGAALFQQVVPVSRGRQQRFAGCLEPGELDMLDRVLDKLIKEAEALLEERLANPPRQKLRRRA